MIGADVLLTTAELSLALGGFGSVVAAFMGNRKPWNPIEIVRFRVLIVISLTAALLALIPFPLFHSGLKVSELWAVASMIAAALSTLVFIGMLWFARTPMVNHGSRLWSLIAMFMACLAVAINAFNALGIGFDHSFTGYFTGLLCMLILAGLYFIRMVAVSGPQVWSEPPHVE